MGRKWSWDAPWDMWAMSDFSTITSLAESPKIAGLVYAGTDDGLIQVTEDGGKNWRSISVGSLPGVPKEAFVNDIKADLFDANTVYVALDNHKNGDFSPYLLKSTNRGRSWTSLSGTLPKRHLVWRVVQDHVAPGLMFAGTEFGVFFTVDGGREWIKLEGKAPTISFRDLAIQRRENDLVGATFGRGFWILDDYSPLREVSKKVMEGQSAKLFPLRDAHWYIERRTLGGDTKASQGHGYYTAHNPPFGAVFTYYLRDPILSREKARQKAEKPLLKDGKDTPFQGFDSVEEERREKAPQILLLVKDSAGETVRRVYGSTKAGIHRVAWDLRYPPLDAIDVKAPSVYGNEQEPVGVLAAPGTYSATLLKKVDGKTTVLDGPVSFEVKRLREGALPGAKPEAVVAFYKRASALHRGLSGFQHLAAYGTKRMEFLGKALQKTPAAPDALDALDAEYRTLRLQLDDLVRRAGGNPSKAAIGAPEVHTVATRLGNIAVGVFYSTYGPTPTHREQMKIAETEFEALRQALNTWVSESVPAFEAKLQAAGGPWTPGQLVPGLSAK